jgi:hypothetical protein
MKARNLVLIVLIVLAKTIVDGADVGSWLLIQPQGAVVQIDANPVKILEKQFGARSVDQINYAYAVTVPGQVSAMLPESLGYAGTKIVEKDNTTNITIIASPESVITNYLRKSLNFNY